MLTLVGRVSEWKKWTVEHILTGTPLARLFLIWTEHEIAEGAVWEEPSYEERDKMDEYTDVLALLRG